MSDPKIEGRESRAEGTPVSQPSTLNPQLSPSQRAWRRFFRNKPAVLSLGFFLLVVFVVVRATRVG